MKEREGEKERKKERSEEEKEFWRLSSQVQSRALTSPPPSPSFV
jgi:hypothetical protein